MNDCIEGVDAGRKVRDRRIDISELCFDCVDILLYGCDIGLNVGDGSIGRRLKVIEFLLQVGDLLDKAVYSILQVFDLTVDDVGRAPIFGVVELCARWDECGRDEGVTLWGIDDGEWFIGARLIPFSSEDGDIASADVGIKARILTRIRHI